MTAKQKMEVIEKLTAACEGALRLLEQEYTGDGVWPRRSIKDELTRFGSERVAQLLRDALNAAVRTCY